MFPNQAAPVFAPPTVEPLVEPIAQEPVAPVRRKVSRFEVITRPDDTVPAVPKLVTALNTESVPHALAPTTSSIFEPPLVTIESEVKTEVFIRTRTLNKVITYSLYCYITCVLTILCFKIKK